MTLRFFVILSLLLPGVLLTGARAAEPDSAASVSDSVRNLHTFVVTGTRTPKLLKDSPVLTRLITYSDIRRTDPLNITDLLQSELPGVEFTYAMNQQVAVNMQGFGGNSVLFLVDGERLAGETLDNVDYNRLDMSNVGRVEIVKGSASALYGSNAVGGVVNIISREEYLPRRLNLTARWGAHGEQRYGLSAGFSAGPFRSTTSARFHSIDSYDMRHPGDFSRFHGGHNWQLKERLTFSPSGNLRLIARASYYYRQRNSAVSTRDRYRDFTAGLRGVWDLSAADNLEMAYNFDQYDKSDFMVSSHRDVRKYSNVQNGLRALWSHTFAAGAILTAGGDVMRDWLKSWQFENGGDHSQTTADVFAQIDFKLFERLNIVAGGRFDRFSRSRMSHFSSRLSVMSRLGAVTLRGSYAGGFRPPTLKEMFMDFDMAGIFMIYGNPDLRAETSHNFQLSAEYARGPWAATLSAFSNIVNDRITTAWNTDLKGQFYINIGRVNINGLEANLSWKSPRGFGARMSYMFVDEHVAKGQPYTSSTRPHSATVQFDYSRSWRPGSFSLALSGRLLSKVTVDEFTSLTSYEQTEKVTYPAYMMWKLNLSQTILRGIRLTAAIDNLLNYIPKYYYNNSPATDGITFSAGISVDVEEFFAK